MLKLKKIKKLLLSLLFSECFHLYLRKPPAAKAQLLMCCITCIEMLASEESLVVLLIFGSWNVFIDKYLSEWGWAVLGLEFWLLGSSPASLWLWCSKYIWMLYVTLHRSGQLLTFFPLQAVVIILPSLCQLILLKL